jgi:hypothetical protein
MIESYDRAIWISTLAVLAAGCVPTTTTTTRTIRQTALVPPPSGFHAAGAPLAEDTYGVEGSISGAWVRTVDQTRSDGAVGHLVADKAISLRGAYAPHEIVEVGFDVRASLSTIATPTAIDMREEQRVEELEDRPSIWAGPQLRVRLFEIDRIGFHLQGELSGGQVPYQRTIYTHTEVTAHFPERDISTTTKSVDRQADNEFFLLGRAGGFLSARLDEHVTLTAGGLAQNTPEYFGQEVVSRTCRWEDVNSPAECEGQTDDDVEPSRQRTVGTFFSSLTIDLGGVSLVAQTYFNALGPRSIVRTTPLGLDLSLRAEF